MPPFLAERTLLDVGGASEAFLSKQVGAEVGSYLTEARARLKEAGCKVPSIETKLRYGWIREVLDGVVVRSQQTKLTTSDRIDRLFTHRAWGVAIFLVLMFFIFQSIFIGDKVIGQPFGLSDDGLFGGLIGMAQSGLGSLVESILPPGPLQSLLVDGVIAGAGGIFVFVPQIALLFFFIAILEDCGYMARVAFLMDKLMTKLGLSGRSFLPLLSSFACAVPGIMATRVIENRRDRMVTILVAPLMSCSARVPVYVLMVSAFLPEKYWLGHWISLHAIILFAMQLLGAIVAIPVAWILKRWLFPGQTPPFVMELPAYKWPSWRVVFQRVWERISSFVGRAGSLILVTSILVWAACYFPSDHTRAIEIKSQIERLAEDPSKNEEEWQDCTNRFMKRIVG